MHTSLVAVTYEVTLNEIGALARFLAVNDYAYKYARRWQAATSASIIVLIGAVFAAAQGSFSEAMVPLGLAIAIASYVAITHYRAYAERFARYVTSRYQQAEARGALGSQRLSIADPGLSLSNDHFSTEMSWSMIIRVVCMDAHIFLFTGPLNAYVIPQRSLQGASFEEVRNAFLRHGTANSVAVVII